MRPVSRRNLQLFFGPPRAQGAAQAVTGQKQSFYCVFQVEGNEALNFSKDLQFSMEVWDFQDAEALHQNVLNFLQFCHQQNLKVRFALAACLEQQLILASSGYQIALLRNAKLHQIQSGNQAFQFVVGSWRENDLIIALKNDDQELQETFKNWQLTTALTPETLQQNLQATQEKNRDLPFASAFFLFPKEKKLNQSKKFLASLSTFLQKSISAIKKIPQFLKKILEICKKIFFRLKQISPKEFRHKILPVMGLAFVFIAAFVFWQQSQARHFQNDKERIDQLVENIPQLRQQVLEQPLLARETAEQILQELNTIPDQELSSAGKNYRQEQREVLAQLIQEISGENDLDRLQVAFDLSSFQENFLGKKIHSFDKKIYVLESNQKEILEIDSTQNTHRIIPAPSEALIRDFAALDNRLILLSDGLWQIDLDSLEKKQLKTQGESDQEATLLAVYENYFYLFNPSKRNIYRFTETNDGLSEAIGWLVDKQGLDFTSIQDMAVDGDLWLSDNTGKILRYSRGYQSDFQIQGLAEAPSDTLEIEAKPESETLLAFDKAAKRLLIFRKNGEFLSQIRSNELAAVTDVSLVSEQLAYALSGSILYQIQW